MVDCGARDAEPLLFVHGWGLSSAAFGPFLDCMARRNRVIAPDLPGFGRSGPLGRPVSYAAFADALAGVLDDCGIGRAHVAGLSMGGGIALTLAVRHPRRVRSLILMAPTGCPDVSLPRLACNRVIEFAEEVMSPVNTRGRARVARTFGANLLRHPANLLATLRMLASRSIVEDVAQVTVPTLLLWGDRDRTIPPGLAQEFIARLPQATLHVIPATFHEMAAARPAQTAAIIDDFIQAQAGDRPP